MSAETKPQINITPLIDVLLVLLIIFMVVSPLKPSSFKTKIPAESKTDEKVVPNPKTLIVAINPDSSLKINGESFGTIAEPEKLIEKLSAVFADRLENRVYFEGAETKNDLTEEEKIERTVFIKAPRDFSYGGVAKVVDAVKLSGARPIGLQIDGLE